MRVPYPITEVNSHRLLQLMWFSFVHDLLPLPTITRRVGCSPLIQVWQLKASSHRLLSIAHHDLKLALQTLQESGHAPWRAALKAPTFHTSMLAQM